MNTSFNGKVAFVTGAASGIGAAIVSALLAEGAKVVGADINEASLTERAREFGANFSPVRTDVTVEAQVQAAVGTVFERFGKLDAAFNVAGTARVANIVNMAESDWDFVTNLCMKAVFLCIKHEGRRMAKGGSIVNITSLNARVPGHGMAAYTAAKAAADMLSRNAALELAPLGIRVNSIQPGLVDTPLAKGFSDIPEALAAYIERIPLARMAQPAEIAAPALFLASDAASYVSGASLVVDGAWDTTAYPDLRPWLGLFSEPV